MDPARSIGFRVRARTAAQDTLGSLTMWIAVGSAVAVAVIGGVAASTIPGQASPNSTGSSGPNSQTSGPNQNSYYPPSRGFGGAGGFGPAPNGSGIAVSGGSR